MSGASRQKRGSTKGETHEELSWWRQDDTQVEWISHTRENTPDYHSRVEPSDNSNIAHKNWSQNNSMAFTPLSYRGHTSKYSPHTQPSSSPTNHVESSAMDIGNSLLTTNSSIDSGYCMEDEDEHSIENNLQVDKENQFAKPQLPQESNRRNRPKSANATFDCQHNRTLLDPVRPRSVSDSSRHSSISEDDLFVSTTNSTNDSQISGGSINDSPLSPHFKLTWPSIDPIIDCAEYSQHIFSNFRQKELQNRPNPAYMTSVQQDINPHMRSILVDWLIDVGQEYRLSDNTVYLAVNYTDRFLSVHPVTRDRLQLCGVTSLMIAAKYNEQLPPSVDDFVFITDNTYSRRELLQMEILMLNTLRFSMCVVTPLEYLQHFIRVSPISDPESNDFAYVLYLSQYLSEICLQNYEFLRFTSSIFIGSCIVVALHTLNLPCWTCRMQQYYGYTATQLANCVEMIYRAYRHHCYHQNQLHAAREKYSGQRFRSVSLQTPHAESPHNDLLRLGRLVETQRAS